jgi:hypothetical protein
MASKPRNCHVCKSNGDIGVRAIGRRRVGGAELNGRQIEVGGQLVNAGLTINVCQDHADMLDVTRAEVRVNGTEARQSAESFILSATEDEQEAKAARAARLAELNKEVWKTITDAEALTLHKHATTVSYRAARGTLSDDSATEETLNSFVSRVADRALVEVADTVPAPEAVTMVDRAAVLQGLGHVHTVRTGSTSKHSSTDAVASVTVAGADLELFGNTISTERAAGDASNRADEVRPVAHDDDRFTFNGVTFTRAEVQVLAAEALSAGNDFSHLKSLARDVVTHQHGKDVKATD